MAINWEPVAERWTTTLRRTGLLALAVGAGVSLYKHRLGALAPWTVFALWLTLGGHVVEVLFRNRLRFFIPAAPLAQASARLVYWFLGGAALCAGALATVAALTGRHLILWPWWAGGLLFIGVEGVAHLFLLLRGQSSFYDGRG